MAEYPLIPKEKCPHVGDVRVTHSDMQACVQCGITNHLRQCTSCGKVFCCESDNAHNKQHFEETGHPIIKSQGTPYDFYWCYECKGYIDM